MDWREAIKDMRQAQENNRLVLFVGAGVSANSNLPTWYDLIKNIAQKVGYVKCSNSCDDCDKNVCNFKSSEYTQDEFLRIPEYLYAEGEEEYFKFITKHFVNDHEPNDIDEQIINILPHHIITTNYDKLLEKCKNINSKLYTVVCQDSDMLSQSNDRYIIKMHGDIDRANTIILRESDYIEYEQKHILISTFIRSLLINHTFVFVGYSLNDYNLRLIIGWINYYKNVYEVGNDNRPRNYLITTKVNKNDHEKKRLERNNIFSIDLNDLPEELICVATKNSSLTAKTGKQLYAFLRCITDYTLFYKGLPQEVVLLEKYTALSKFTNISIDDFIKAHRIERIQAYCDCLRIYDEQWYRFVEKQIKEKTKLLSIYQKLYIKRFCLGESNESIEIERVPENDVLFELYINNDYIRLNQMINESNDVEKKIYYYSYFNKDINLIIQLCEDDEKRINYNDYVSLILCKLRAFLAQVSFEDLQQQKRQELQYLFQTAPSKYQNVLGYLKEIFDCIPNKKLEMQELLKKQEKRYESNSNTAYSDHAFSVIWEMQPLVYDFYCFIKGNNIPIDHFNDFKSFFSIYIKSIMITYSSSTELGPNTENTLLFTTHRKHYPINCIDLDIIVKYTNPKVLSQIIRDYSVQAIEFDCDLNVVEKFKNLVEWCVYDRKKNWFNQLSCFIQIMYLAPVSVDEKTSILRSIVNLLDQTRSFNWWIEYELFELICKYILDNRASDADELYCELLEIFILSPSFNNMRSYRPNLLKIIIKSFAKYANEQFKNKILATLDSMDSIKDELDMISFIYPLFPANKFNKIIQDNIEIIDDVILFNLVVDKIIPFSDELKNKYINSIFKLASQKRDNPSIKTYPDWLSVDLELCILLFLLGFDMDLSFLSDYEEFSVHLKFMLHPDTFDYSQVDLNDNMWQNLIYSDQFRDYFIKQKDIILSEKIRKTFKLHADSRPLQKIVYGMLLSDQELRWFGDR